MRKYEASSGKHNLGSSSSALWDLECPFQVGCGVVLKTKQGQASSFFGNSVWGELLETGRRKGSINCLHSPKCAHDVTNNTRFVPQRATCPFTPSQKRALRAKTKQNDEAKLTRIFRVAFAPQNFQTQTLNFAPYLQGTLIRNFQIRNEAWGKRLHMKGSARARRPTLLYVLCAE